MFGKKVELDWKRVQICKALSIPFLGVELLIAHMSALMFEAII